MPLYAPSYYSSFQCIADKCLHSCCIGWEIDVDEEALARYRAIESTDPCRIIDSIACEEDEAPHFRLRSGERCPHLDGRGLCRIILSHGEDYLCEICREHPRFYHETLHGTEVGIGMSCEEACRLILTSPDYAVLPLDGTPTVSPETETFDATAHRAHLYSILGDTALPYGERLSKIKAAYDIPDTLFVPEKIRPLLAALEYLNEEHRTRFAKYCPTPQPAPLDAVSERALAYFILRHCSPCESPAEFRAALSLSILCERLIASFSQNGSDAFEAARTVSEEIEYSEDNTEAILAHFACGLE